MRLEQVNERSIRRTCERANVAPAAVLALLLETMNDVAPPREGDGAEAPASLLRYLVERTRSQLSDERAVIEVAKSTEGGAADGGAWLEAKTRRVTHEHASQPREALIVILQEFLRQPPQPVPTRTDRAGRAGTAGASRAAVDPVEAAGPLG